MVSNSKVVGKPFKAGQSGNPGGRSKGYERLMREAIDSMTAEDPMPDVADPSETRGASTTPKLIPAWQAIVKRAVLDAVKGNHHARDWIADRLLGKPKQQVELETREATGIDVTGWSDEELLVLAGRGLFDDPTASSDVDETGEPSVSNTEH